MRTGGWDHQSPETLLDLVMQRYRFLAVLDAGACQKRALQETIGVSRSTVDRACRQLEAGGLVHRTQSGYRTTLYGSILIAIYDSMVDYVDSVHRARALLAELPADSDVDLDLIIGAEIAVVEAPLAQTPTGRLTDLIEAASKLKGLVFAHPAPNILDLIDRKIRVEGMETELVFRHELFRSLKATRSDVVEALSGANQYTAAVTDSLPYGLFVATIDDCDFVCLSVYNADDTLKGIMVNDTTKAVAWGVQTFNRYHDRAKPLPPE